MRIAILVSLMAFGSLALADTAATIEEEILADLKRVSIDDPSPGRRAFVASQLGSATSATQLVTVVQVSAPIVTVRSVGYDSGFHLDARNPLIAAQQQVELEKAWDKALDPIVQQIWNMRSQ